MADGELQISATIDRDVPCRSCGYNLRGLAASGACPECAAAVQDSLTPNELIWFAAGWLRQIWFGLQIAMAAYVSIAVVIGVQVLLVVWPRLDLTAGSGVAWSAIALATCVLLFLVGIVLSTRAGSRLDTEIRAMRIRRVVRGGAFILSIVTVLAVPGPTSALIDIVGGIARYTLSLAFFIAIFSAFGVTCIAYPMWLNLLLSRASTGTPAPSPTIAQWFGVAMLVLLVTHVSAHALWLSAASDIAMTLFVPAGFAYFVALYLSLWRCADAVAYDERLARERASQSNGAT